jgi:hypothetical protein
VLALLRYLAEIDAKQGQELCGEYHDDGDPAVSKRHGAPSSYFFYHKINRSRDCGRALRKDGAPATPATGAPRRPHFRGVGKGAAAGRQVVRAFNKRL